MMQVRFLSDAFGSTVMKDSNKKRKLEKDTIKDEALFLKELFTDYGKILFPLLLLILVCVTVVISLNARNRVEAAAAEAVLVLEESKEEVQEVKETLFEEDAYPEVNNVINSYYSALEMADIDALVEVQSSITSTETLRLQKMSEYVDRYENIHVYTKPGPHIDSYVAYVYSEVYLKDFDIGTPGLQAFYVCMDENGNYYINTNELTDEESQYIKNIASQGDVQDLKNSVNVSYSTIMEENPELSAYWAEVSVEIDLAVGEQLSLEAKLQAQLEEPEETEEEETVEETVPTVTRVKATEQVNIRKSASTGGERLGTAYAGDVFVLIEKMANGWTKVNYDGTEAYISSEYLVDVEDASQYETSTTGVVNTGSLNVRSEASSESTKLGVLTKDTIVEIIEISGEWAKIKYDGQVGYVMAEYLTQ